MSARYDAVFEKKGDMAYVSHLDLMRLFRRAIRRAGLPFVLSEGFTPRVRISIPKALKLGLESESEQMSFWLAEDAEERPLAGSINAQLPEGVKILTVKRNDNS